jgi:cytochrome P450
MNVSNDLERDGGQVRDRGAEFLAAAFDPANREDPYPLYAAMREQTPVLDASNHLWFTFTHGAANSVLRSRLTSSDERRSSFFQEQLPTDERFQEYAEQEPLMLFTDPPHHTRLRSLVSAAFTPSTVERMVPRIQRFTDRLLDEIDPSGPVDVVEALAYPLPIAVICDLLGVPAEDEPVFGHWSKILTRGLDPGALRTAEEEAAIDEASAELQTYIVSLLASRRKQPADDLVSALIAVRDGADRLREPELVQLVLLLLVAGHETTVNLIGNGIVALLRHPDQLARWQGEPTLDKNAVDELLRYDSPVQLAMRVALEPMDVDGVEIPAFDQILTLLGAANRDPAVFPDPDRLDLGRENAGRNMSFGGGIHHCLGMALARTEGQIALGGLIRRFGQLELVEEPFTRERFVLRGYERVLVEMSGQP